MSVDKSKFLKAYSNLPEPEREQTIAIVEDQPYSWKRAYSEIKEDTALGKKILKKIKELGII